MSIVSGLMDTQLLYVIPLYFSIVRAKSMSTASIRIVPVVIGNAMGTVATERLVQHSKIQDHHSSRKPGWCSRVRAHVNALAWRDELDRGVVCHPAGSRDGYAPMHDIRASSRLRGQVGICARKHDVVSGSNVGVLVGASLSVPLINLVVTKKLEQGMGEQDDQAEV